MMGLGANFIMREAASSANSYANCHYDIADQDTFSIYFRHSFYRHKVFILIFFSLPDSGVSSKNLVFSSDGCQEGWEGGMFLKKGGISRRLG